MTDVAVELRARAEKARAEANRSAASDGLLYAGLMVEARTYDEAASLVESSQHWSPATDAARKPHILTEEDWNAT